MILKDPMGTNAYNKVYTKKAIISLSIICNTGLCFNCVATNKQAPKTASSLKDCSNGIHMLNPYIKLTDIALMYIGKPTIIKIKKPSTCFLNNLVTA
jgi:hypothetical protein